MYCLTSEDVYDLWYENQRQGLGKDFLDAVSNSLKIIAERPFLYPIIYRNTHRALIHRFPFGIFYRVEKELIVVIGVMHGSRNPRRWKERE